MKKINDNERKVLEVISVGWDELYYNFAYISKETGLDVKSVRRACRSLKRKGYADFKKGLMNDDGMVAGSGYGATHEGALLINRCVKCGYFIGEYDGLCYDCHHERKLEKDYLFDFEREEALETVVFLNMDEIERDNVLALMNKVARHRETAFGGCRKCYGKGYATSITYSKGVDEFDSRIRVDEKNQEEVFCGCERGRELEKRFKEAEEKGLKRGLKRYERKKSKSSKK